MDCNHVSCFGVVTGGAAVPVAGWLAPDGGGPHGSVGSRGGTGRSGDMNSFQKTMASALVDPLDAGVGLLHLYFFPLLRKVLPSCCGRAGPAAAFGVGTVTGASCGVRSKGMAMGVSGGSSGVYDGLAALAAGGSHAAVVAATGDPGGVHPLALSLDCHILCHVFESSPLLDASLSGDSEDESG